jgi:nitrogen fixation NifU-like protein
MNDAEIYQERIMDHYEDPFHRGRCPSATHRHQDDNPLCGDIIQIELRIDDAGKITDAWFDGEGCCISQAAASMLMEQVCGKTVDQVRTTTAEQMLELFGPRLTPNRQKCCLLSWKVLQGAVFSPVQDDPPVRPAGSNLVEES